MWPAFSQTPHAHYCDDPQGYEESLYRKPHVPAGRFANKAFLLLLKLGEDNGDFATVGASGRSRGRFLATLERRLPG